ncbi:hypothetical protein PENFLA_c001G07641 [Penicillium flavigenum]|uniref:Uncharacterized protein n=1 Tax=Penicillium flavigenum TaxID=254877 RepID=A0A1V6U2W8_9EURO|nr:hypothetical protein PENFLA_c001G07641 [Penicillium flavigenum]
MDTDVPIVDTGNLAASSTDYATAIEPNDEYPQFPVDRNRSNCANNDIAVDITSTGPTTRPNVGDEYVQLHVHRDSDEDKSYLAVHNELPNANNGPVTAVELVFTLTPSSPPFSRLSRIRKQITPWTPTFFSPAPRSDRTKPNSV